LTRLWKARESPRAAAAAWRASHAASSGGARGILEESRNLAETVMGPLDELLALDGVEVVGHGEEVR
jgi:type IV secretory pathway VirB2 component (pilin)